MFLLLYLFFGLTIQSLYKCLEDLLLVLVLNGQICDKTESILRSQHSFKLFAEEVLDDGAVATKEIKGHGVIMLHSLGYIDDPHFILMIKKIVLAEISVDKLAPLIHTSDDKDSLQITLVPVIYVGITKSWRSFSIFSDKFHDDDVVL